MERFRLDDKVAIVTGASRGIGRAIALTLAGSGADIVVADIDVGGANRVAEQIKASGRRAMALKVDVSDRADVNRMVEETLRAFSKVDILVNNAGIVGQVAPFVDTDPSDWDRVIKVNLLGTLNCTKAVLKHMIDRKQGRIISISSGAGLEGDATITVYSATKAAIIALTRAIAKEVAPYGITVNDVAPGMIETDLLNIFPDRGESFRTLIPMQRFGTPEEVADAVLYLASRSADYITGWTICISGGKEMK